MIFRKEQPIPEEAVSLREQRAMQGDRLSFAASEAYKLLRTNLTFALPDEKKCRVVGVTSAMRGEGKSTTSINLAYTLAETGKKVLLIEAASQSGAPSGDRSGSGSVQSAGRSVSGTGCGSGCRTAGQPQGHYVRRYPAQSVRTAWFGAYERRNGKPGAKL